MNKASLRYSAIFPFNFEEPLTSVAKTTNLTEVTPAKKITFYKSGDPQLTGVKMTVNKRAFKTFDALLDDLTQKISLPFAVRTVTTPHGIHGINSLEQLEDGGSYICSHKKHVQPIPAGKVTWQGQKPISPHRYSTRRERQEDSHAHRTQMAHKNIILIKNGNVGIHYSIVLHKRNTHSFRGFLGEISELMQYSVRKLYTMDGTNIDTLQALFHCPSVLVCVGHEAFKPIVNEKFRRRLSERMPGLSRRSRANVNNESDDIKRNVNFGLEAKKSVIHPRSPSRSSRFSISADKSYTKGSNMSSSNSGYASFADSLPHKKDGELMNSVIDDDIEKKVHVNKDGSLSLEMKVRFRLLHRETLQWSTQIRKSGFARKTRNEHLCSVEDFAMEQDDQRNTDNGFDGSVDPCDADDFYVSKLDCTESEENHYENCKYGQGYDIWENPMYAGQDVKANSGNGRYAHSSFSGPAPYPKAAYERKSAESIQTISSEEYSQHFVQQMENQSETVGDGEGGIEYCSVSHCSSQSGSFTSASKNGGYRKGGASFSRSTTSHHISSPSSTNISHQNTHDETPSGVSSNNSTASSKGKVATKTIDIGENIKPTTSRTNSEEVSVDLKEVDSSIGPDKPASTISESFRHLKCNKQIKGERNSERRAQNLSSSCSKHSDDSSKESVALNHLCSSPSSSCSNQFNGKTNDIRDAGFAEEGKAYSIASSGSLHSDKNSNGEIYEDNKPSHDVLLSSKKSHTYCHSKQNLNISGRQSSPEILGINDELHLPNNDTNGRPVSNTTYSSSKKSNKQTKNMDANEGSTCSVPSCLSTSSAAQMMPSSLIAGKGGYVSCAENINEKKRVKRTTSIQSEQSSLSDHAEIIVTNSVNKSKKFSNTESLNRSSSRSKKVKSEDECRLPTPTSGNSDPSVEVDDDGKASNEDNTPALDTSGFSEVLQIENNTKMECERCEKAHSICLIVSKASGDKAAAKSQGQVDVLDQTNISKLSNPAELELLSCKTAEDTITHTNSITEDVSVEGRPQSFAQWGIDGGESTGQLLMDPALQSKSSISTDEVTGCKLPASRPTTSTCNLSDESTTDKPHKENGIKSDSGRSSEKVNSKETFKVNNNNKKNKNKKSTFTSTVACGKIDLIPGVLPNASFEDIVHEWLKKIPSENMLVKYDNTEEFQDKCEKSATDEVPAGGKSETKALTTLDEKPHGVESTVGNQGSKEKHNLMMVKLENSGSLMAEAKSSGQEVVQEVDALQPNPVSSCCSGLTTTNQLHEKVLRNNVHSSVEAIKVLLSSGQRAKLDRSNSLPSLNLTLKSKLSHSAKALLTCLASVQLFDEETLDSENKLIKTNNSAQKELLSILKSLWFTDIMIEGEGEVSQTSEKHSKTFKGHNSADDNVTPLSSSGVDINSGSGGSGDGSMGGVTEAPPTGEKKNGNLYLQTYTNKKDDASKQNQPSLMKKVFDENSEIRIEQNKKNEDYSISSADSTMINAPCRKLKQRNWNETNKSEDNDNIDKRSLSRASEVSQSDVAPSSPVTPDIACRVQWSSGEQSEDLDEIIDSNTRTSPQATNQNLKEQSSSEVEEMKPLAGASCDLEEIVHRTKTQGQNETVDVNYSEEDKIVHNKITEKCDNIGMMKTPQQITSGHCYAAQAVKPDQEPAPTKRKSFNPDPSWLMKLLKKMEMQFIADYVDAMNEFKIRWNLEADDRLDQMIENFSEDIRRRIKESVERELMKVQCRAGRNKPSPPLEPRRSESSEQTEQRWKRLKAMYKMQTFTPHSNEPDHEHNTKDFSSLISDEELAFCAMLGDNSDSHEQFSPDKFCPCDSCTEKSKTPKLVKNAMQKNIPIVKDFDLREILRMKMSRPNEQIKKHVTDTNGPEELLDRKIDKLDSGESESLELVENKIKNVIQNDEPVNLNQENIDVNNECQNHKLDGMLDQGEEQVSTGNHVVGLNLEDIDEEKKQVNESKDEDKSEDGKSLSVASENALEPNEGEEGDIYRVENEHKNGKEENDDTEHNNEVTNTGTEESKEQDEENNVLCNNTDPEMENNNTLEELLSVDSQEVYEMSGNNVRYTVENNSKVVHEMKHLNNNVSERSDTLVKSNVIKSRNEEVVEIMNAKLPLEQSGALDVNSCPQHSDEGMPENSAKESTEGDLQIDTQETISSSSNSPGNKSSQMYPESSSDEDTKSNCTSPEVPENEKHAGNNSDPDQEASMQNRSKKPGNTELDEDDFDF
ncbi:retinitis pigmentosa 1-like 1 protein [Scyliorhinus canicula]|uniref:retinitis pigmentosa 1-like 1 protein n=1 Tax=Scyliorhinus canicula TaxID=7830 RepID=UPI0018F30EB8|nr:retinitis pigmentosa 1-like 1 protein [Scyliorhinus canicula]